MKDKDQNRLMILDCTLRDGGYYTNWDFKQEIVDTYFATLNNLPIDYIEIGYRSLPSKKYAGAYYYLPEFLLKECRGKSSKKLAIILNEKEISSRDVANLLQPCVGIIDLVRIAVDPKNFNRAVHLAKTIKDLGFKTAFNLMYASNWKNLFEIDADIEILNEVVDYFYVVDSFGGMLPEEVETLFIKLQQYLIIPLGFHGHNNLELAFANTLASISAGASIVDATVFGMGRGAGNLKMELLLTILHKKYEYNINFDELHHLSNLFIKLNNTYNWGSNLPYMISGAHSLAQNNVNSQVKKRFFSLNDIVPKTNQNLDVFNPLPYINKVDVPSISKIILVGGGGSTQSHKKVLQQFIQGDKDMGVVYVSSRNVNIFQHFSNPQFHCLPGREVGRLHSIFNSQLENRFFIIPHLNLINKSYPNKFISRTQVLESVTNEISATEMAFKLINMMNPLEVYITGYDGYGARANSLQRELFEENQLLFNKELKMGRNLKMITPSEYDVPVESIYQLL
ncbi:aldolase catalytic domain-containing protein [Gillisia sp. M10.2A]|uniref:Aldolase catalytic domain-containing protein n=1 Tax=Gillisia lutea TaxID=2909668 RepID=A0ABS9EIR1_9FLAO|nr:aldolase catalytic domain-containing protein [Gillisia lutea]MCF4102673.1 aldolase catalytic domain-containing protein [Gillisia lutea]